MRRRALVTMALLAAGVARTAAAQGGSKSGANDGGSGDGMFHTRRGDPDMERAYARARADLPAFLALAAAPPPGTRNFAVKVGFSDTGSTRTEFFWITPFERRGDGFAGRLANAPVYVRRLRAGQEVTFAESEIVDWYYLDAEGRMHGNRTACAGVARQGRAAPAEMERRYGMRCER